MIHATLGEKRGKSINKGMKGKSRLSYLCCFFSASAKNSTKMGIRKHFMCRVLIMKVKLYLVFKGVKKIIQSKNKLIMVVENGLLKAYITY